MSLQRVSLAVVLASAVLGVAQAQPLPRSFDASPEVYRVIAKDEQFKVLSVTWKPGQKDALHSHPASAVYYLTDCSLRIYAHDGTFRDAKPIAGMAIVQKPIPGHILENTGASDCRLVMFEPA
jgi:predicted metal-dependent enzyme (double-stranded beta helix superfamily)